MKLLELSVHSFRNIEHLKIKPAQGVNLFWGGNAQGKTNLLESIYYLVTGRSFRTRQDRDVLPWNAPSETVATVHGKIQTHQSQYQIVVAIAHNQKQITSNGKTLASLGLLWGKMNAVLFTPSDLDVVQGPPTIRRRFLDMEGCQINHSYLYHLQRYAQVLRQRNALLKSNIDEQDLVNSLDTWDEQLAVSAAEIFCFRRDFIKRLARAAQKLYSGIADSNETLDLAYDNFIGTDDTGLNAAAAEELYRIALRRSRGEDLYRGLTTCGPHRDDFHILIGGQDARTFASQGQQRSAIIALRLAEIQLMQEYTGRTPLLLLDDIVSELDEHRRHHFLSLLKPRLQTFITGTDADTLRGSLPVEKTFHIHAGNIV